MMYAGLTADNAVLNGLPVLDKRVSLKEIVQYILMDLYSVIYVSPDVGNAVRLVRLVEYMNLQQPDLMEPLLAMKISPPPLPAPAESDSHAYGTRGISKPRIPTPDRSDYYYGIKSAAENIYNPWWLNVMKEGAYINLLPSTTMSKRNDNTWYRAKITAFRVEQLAASSGCPSLYSEKGNPTKLKARTLASIHFLKWSSKYDIEVDVSAEDTVILPDNSVLAPVKSRKRVADPAEGATETAAEERTSENEHVEPVVLSRSGRVLKLKAPSLAVTTTSMPEISRTTDSSSADVNERQDKKVKKRRLPGEEEEDINDWLCARCGLLESRTGSKLMLCDGPCLRSFHTDCLPASPVRY
jgi:hypothetical protein